MNHAVKYFSAIGLLLVGISGSHVANAETPSKQIKKGKSVNQAATSYQLIQAMSRQQIIGFAKTKIRAVLGDIYFEDYPLIRARANATVVHIQFISNIEAIEKNATTATVDPSVEARNEISFYASAEGEQVSPANRSKLLVLDELARKISKSFEPTDVITLTDLGDAVEAHVRHADADRSTGGREKYKIDKRTFSREMTFHVHPRERQKIESEDPNDVNTYREIPEAGLADLRINLHEVDASEIGVGPLYKSLVGKSRSEIIRAAGARVLTALPGIKLEDYSHVRVFKTSKTYRVDFRANFVVTEKKSPTAPGVTAQDDGGLQDSVSFYSSESGDKVLPTDRKFLYSYTDDMREIRKEFGSTDHVTLKESDTSFAVEVRRASTPDRRGAVAYYRIDKKTKEKSLVADKRPQPRVAIGPISNPSEQDPEIEILD